MIVPVLICRDCGYSGAGIEIDVADTARAAVVVVVVGGGGGGGAVKVALPLVAILLAVVANVFDSVCSVLLTQVGA